MNTYLRLLVTEDGLVQESVKAESIEEAIEKFDYAPFWGQHVAERLMDEWPEADYEAWCGRGLPDVQRKLEEQVLAERRRLAYWFYNVGGAHPPYRGYMDHVEAVIIEVTHEGETTTYCKP